MLRQTQLLVLAVALSLPVALLLALALVRTEYSATLGGQWQIVRPARPVGAHTMTTSTTTTTTATTTSTSTSTKYYYNKTKGLGRLEAPEKHYK